MAGNPFSYSPGFPQDFTFVDEAQILRPAWHYFLQSLWQRVGASTPTLQSLYVQLINGLPQLFQAITGNPIGQIGIIQPKVTPVKPVLVVTPFVFQAPETGFMTVPGGKVSYSRDGTTYYEVTLTGGQIVILVGDFVKIEWFNPAGPPEPVVWWGGGFAQ